jgi:predicted nuclease of predicted toxin-antitoxin system
MMPRMCALMAWHAASDEAIVSRAREEDRVTVSADSDFGSILAAPEVERPSFILFRQPNLLSASDYVKTLLLRCLC